MAANTCVWNSGVQSSNATLVVYSGPPLSDDTSYYWIVRWWDVSGNQAPDSAVAVCNVAIVNAMYWVTPVWYADPVLYALVCITLDCFVRIGSTTEPLNVMRREFVAPAGLVQVRCVPLPSMQCAD